MRERVQLGGKGCHRQSRAGKNEHGLELRILKRGEAALSRTTSTSGRPGQGWREPTERALDRPERT